MPNNKRKSGCCRACRHSVYVVVRSWLIDKQAKKMQPAQDVVGEAVITWPGAGRCRRTSALSLMSTSLQRNVSCSSSVSRAYALELQRMFEHSNIIRLRFSRTNFFTNGRSLTPVGLFLAYTLRSEASAAALASRVGAMHEWRYS